MWQRHYSPIPRELTFMELGLGIEHIADICYVLFHYINMCDSLHSASLLLTLHVLAYGNLK